MHLSWGGGTQFDDPDFIGKFGFGLPNASINQTRRVEVYTRAKGSKETFVAWLDERFALRGHAQPPLAAGGAHSREALGVDARIRQRRIDPDS
jgi:hypothetical protein